LASSRTDPERTIWKEVPITEGVEEYREEGRKPKEDILRKRCVLSLYSCLLSRACPCEGQPACWTPECPGQVCAVGNTGL